MEKSTNTTIEKSSDKEQIDAFKTMHTQSRCDDGIVNDKNLQNNSGISNSHGKSNIENKEDDKSIGNKIDISSSIKSIISEKEDNTKNIGSKKDSNAQGDSSKKDANIKNTKSDTSDDKSIKNNIANSAECSESAKADIKKEYQSAPVDSDAVMRYLQDNPSFFTNLVGEYLQGSNADYGFLKGIDKGNAQQLYSVLCKNTYFNEALTSDEGLKNSIISGYLHSLTGAEAPRTIPAAKSPTFAVSVPARPKSITEAGELARKMLKSY